MLVFVKKSIFMASNQGAKKQMAIIRIGIADDHTLFRSGLVKLIKGFGRMRVVLEAADGQELIGLLGKMPEKAFPDIVLMDIEMPRMDGMQATEEIARAFPELKVIALSQYEESKIITDIMELGAKAYLLKTAEPHEVESTIWRVYDRGAYYSERVAGAMHNQLQEKDKARKKARQAPYFTRRESQVFELLCKGLSCREIAGKLHNSVSTVEKQRKRVLEKSGCANVVELLSWAMKMGLVSD